MEPDQTLNGNDSPPGHQNKISCYRRVPGCGLETMFPIQAFEGAPEHEICFRTNSRDSLLDTGDGTTSPCSPNKGGTRRDWCRWFIPKRKNPLPRDPRVPRKALHPNPKRVTGGRARLDPAVTARVARAFVDPSVRIRTSRTSVPSSIYRRKAGTRGSTRSHPRDRGM